MGCAMERSHVAALVLGVLMVCLGAYSTVLDADIASTPHVVASGTAVAVNGASMLTLACNTQTTTVTGAAAGDVVVWQFSGDVSATTGFIPLTRVSIDPYISGNTINWRFCNPTIVTLDPASVTIDYKVLR